MEHFVVGPELGFSLPLGLSSDPDGLLNILSNEAWKSLPLQARSFLKDQYLPKFPENTEEEQEETLTMLFSQDNFCFSNPLEKFVELLWEGWFKPNVPSLLDLQKNTQKVLKKKYMFEYHHKLLKDVVVSRQMLIDTALQLGPSQPIRMKNRIPPPKNSKNLYQFEERIRRRYLHELQGIKREIDDKENGFSSDDEQYLGLQDGGVFGIKRAKKDGGQILYIGQERIGVSNSFVEKNGVDVDPPIEITEEMYKNMLRKYRKNRKTNSRSYEYDLTDISLTEIVRRVKSDASSRKADAAKRQATELERQQQNVDAGDESSTDEEAQLNDVSSREKTDSEVDESSAVSEDEFGKEGENEDFETHACFFSLLRDVICSFEDQTATVTSLRSSIRAWQETDVAAANEWFTLIPDGKWDAHLSTALAFLAGHSNLLSSTFTPYIQWQSSVKTYQWIGTFRDNDTTLSGLNKLWNASLETRGAEETAEPSIRERLKNFHEQERRRFHHPSEAFTYRLSGRAYTVGPVAEPVREAGKMRGQCILRKERPISVGFLTLVKDALARLPRGQGTKGEIQELLVQSQYITPQPDERVNLSTLISSALDKIQFEPDPSCKYDSATKAWIYLHKGRSEAEMKKAHTLVKDLPPQSRVPGLKRRKTDGEPSELRMLSPVLAHEPASFSGSPMQMVNPAQVSGKSLARSPSPLAQSPIRAVRPNLPSVPSQIQPARPISTAMAGPSSSLPARPLPTTMQVQPRPRLPMHRLAVPTNDVRQITQRLTIMGRNPNQSLIRPPTPRLAGALRPPGQVVTVPVQAATGISSMSAVRPVRGTTIVVQAADGTRRQVTLPPGFQATAENIRSLAQAIQQRPQGSPQLRQVSPIIRTTNASSFRIRGPSQGM